MPPPTRRARTGERTRRDSGPKIPRPALAVTSLGPAITSEEAPALEVLQQALSGGESSRLYRVLIYEKELAQSAEFGADLRADPGLLTFQMIVAEQGPGGSQKTVHRRQPARPRIPAESEGSIMKKTLKNTGDTLECGGKRQRQARSRVVRHIRRVAIA